MTYIQHLRCLAGDEQFSATVPMNLCPEHGCPVEMVVNTKALRTSFPDGQWFNSEEPSLWRFGALLPFDVTKDSERQHVLDPDGRLIQAGHTPLLPYSEHPVAQQLSLDLRVKDEGEPHHGFGGNPTQSFKDRGMAVVVTMARKLGLTQLAVPTQGNAGDSLAYFANQLGLNAAVIMPDSTPEPIQRNVRNLSQTNPNIIFHPIEGPTINEAGQVMKQVYLPQGYFSVATFQEPGWRIEGKKTLGLEIAEPGIWSPKWDLPEIIIYPTGGGTGILGMWKAFNELAALGLINPEDLPKMICVQSKGTDPLVQAIQRDETDTAGIIDIPGKTAAVGLNVPGGVGHFRVLEIIRVSGGTAISVSEEAIAEEEDRARTTCGFELCPEGAATLAALAPLAETGYIRSSDRVVAFNTGSPFKYRDSGLPPIYDPVPIRKSRFMDPLFFFR